MDTRPDPLGVCTHRNSFIDARICLNRSRPPTSQKKNAVDSSEKDMDLGQTIPCSAGSVQGNVLHIAGSIIGGSTSTIRPDADRSSKALTPPKVFTLSKRSRSCNDLVEPSPTVTRIYGQKSGALRPKDPNMSWTNKFRETDVDGHPSKSHKSPGLPHRGPTDSKPIKTEDHNLSQEIRDVKTHVVHDRLTQLEKDDTQPTQVLLGLSPSIQPINELHVSTAVPCTPRETKEIKKEDDEYLLAASCKTPKNGTRNVGTAIYARAVVDEARLSSHHVVLETPSSSFDISAYLNVDWDFRPQGHSPSSCISVETPKYTDRSRGQVDIRPQPRSSAATSSNSLDGSEALSHHNIGASHKLSNFAASLSNSLDRSEDPNVSAGLSISALDKLNEIILNCGSKKLRLNIDAVERFQRDQTTCLGNTLKGIECRRRNRSEDRQEIKQLLTELAATNFDNNTERCVVKLLKLIHMAVCTYQRKEVQKKVLLLVTPRPLKDSAGRSASPIIKEDAVKVKLEELPDRNFTINKRRTTEGQKVPAIDTSIANLTFKITKWWPKTPKWTSSYSPYYLHFHTEAVRKSDVSQWVMQQAEKPLTPRQCKAGYLYVYWNKATFGIYKIGFTTIDVDKRLKKWESQCKHTAQKQYQSPFKVNNVERLERLVHAELKEFRVIEYGCHGCSGNHEEWFKGVDFQIILESIEFWTKWIMKKQGQYEDVEGTWLLKEDAKKGLPQLCTGLSVVDAKESKEKSITASPRRHNLRPRTAKRSSSQKIRRR